jgi:hypothetical protein
LSAVRRAVVVVGLVTFAWALLALPARATYGARTTADEPQYLLSALSLWEDGDLDIADELRDERWRSFHEADLPEQTARLDGGRRVSPHDPGLAVLLAVPMGLGGWVVAKGVLAAFAGVLAGLLVWVAHRRFAVPLGSAVVVVLAFSLAAPLSAYATQVYPELPAALAVTVAIAAVTGGRPRPWLAGAAVVALPWLGVKYAPVALALALVVWWWGVGRSWRFVAGLGLAAVAYLLFHRAVYGGWTVYAAGDHFVGGELDVVGTDPDYLGRSRRLTGLLVDGSFGLAVWAPVYLLVVPALVSVLWRRPPGWAALVLPAMAGWLTATFVALTMHGWWWPGRQVVVIVPCLVLAVAWWARRLRAVVALGVLGVVAWAWVVVEVLTGRLRLIIDFDDTTFPLFRAWPVIVPLALLAVIDNTRRRDVHPAPTIARDPSARAPVGAVGMR